MTTMTTEAIRAAYLSYMRERGHALIQPAGLIPPDPSTLFTGSGMQPLLPFLLGQDHTSGDRLVDSQPCVRAQDIDEVGDNRHTTFFEMLGNWSLGAYFKAEQIEWFLDFLVDVVHLDPNRLYVTCFAGDPGQNLPRDEESAHLWQQAFLKRGVRAEVAHIDSSRHGDERGIHSHERIFYYDADENWWSRGGGLLETPIGDPCGPDSEVFYDFGDEHHDLAYGLPHPASDGGRFMEIGNQVFMQYRRVEDGSFQPLDRQNVDFGGGLERIAAAALGTPDVYRGSLLWPVIETLINLTGVTYAKRSRELRIITDHLRGAVFMAGDGITPGNKQQAYVMRRLLRRTITTAHTLGLDDSFFGPVVEQIIDIYQDAYPHLREQRPRIVNVFVREESSFRRTLTAGLRLLDRYQTRGLTGADVFLLADTHGFPKELTVEIVRQRHIGLTDDWEDVFSQLREQQRERSRG